MPLLQISEPEQNFPINTDDYAVGIDLGTTNSVIAYKTSKEVEILGPILPSIYGEIRSIKRHMGKNKLVNDLRPEQISAKILLELKSQGEKILNHPIKKAVITVPAHFDDAARNATKIAANLAGIEVLRLVNEPTAAAIAYGLDSNAEGIYLIYDFGGGTFDVSILKMSKGVFQVLATGGDADLGGDDIDYKIMKYLNLPDNLYLIAKEAKEYLSKYDVWRSEYGILAISELNEIVMPFVDKTIEICFDTIKQARVKIDEISQIVLVGGSTKINLVKDEITKRLKRPLDGIDPDLTVAMGAAIQAEALTKGSDNLLIDVTSLSIGLEVMGGMNERIINRNSTIPTSVTKHFTTHKDNQTGIVFNIVQGEREMAADCRSLAKFELKNIPPMKAGLAKVEVTFTIDGDGLLSVSAIEERSQVKQHIEVKPSYGLTKEDIEAMLEQAYLNASADIYIKKLAEAKFLSNNNINSLSEAIREDERAIGDKKLQVLQIMADLSEAMDQDKLEKIEELNHQLEMETKEFIQNRLNKKIKEILKGESTNFLDK